MNHPFTPLFSGGSGRSGTTAIVNLLNHHPQVHTSLPRELKYLTDRFGLLDLNYGRPIQFENSGKEVMKKLISKLMLISGKTPTSIFIERMSDRWWQGVSKKGRPRGLCQGIEFEFLIEQLEKFRKESNSNLILASQRLYFNLSEAQFKKPNIEYFADSTPLNMQNANRINNLIPNSYFINMIRDGRDVALSVSKERWGPDDPHLALRWWYRRILRAHSALAKVPDERKLNLRLEDLILYDRIDSYNSILKFLQLQDVPQLQSEFDRTFTKDKMSLGLWKTAVKSPNTFEKKYLKILKQLASKGIEIKQYY